MRGRPSTRTKTSGVVASVTALSSLAKLIVPAGSERSAMSPSFSANAGSPAHRTIASDVKACGGHVQQRARMGTTPPRGKAA